MTEKADKARLTPTIYDVARAAGVAASTVSRAFARPGRVNADTAERIRQTALSLGYRVNPLARALPTGRTSILGMSVSDVVNPVYAGIIRGAQTAAAEAGFTTLLADGRESDLLERESLERVLSTVEGLLLVSTRMSDSAIRSVAKQKPMVVLNRHVNDVPSVVTDNLAGVRQVARHLAGLGHRSITYVAGPEASWADGARWQALRTVGAEFEITSRRIGPVSPTVAGGAQAAEELRRQPPTAALAYNDQIAIGIIRGLAHAGLDVPGELSVIGFDDIFASSLVTPALTTVSAPLHTMGEIAMRNLLAIINGARPTCSEPLMVPTKLVVRDSTGPARRRTTR